MRVLPWTPHNHPHHHYQLFPAEIDSSAAGPLADPKSGRAKIRRSCARFLLCFGRPSPDASASLPPLNVEPDDGSAGVSASGCRISEVAADGVYDPVKFHPRSSLRKTLPGGDDKEGQEEAEEKARVVLGTAAKRKVQWTDVHGRELSEIREFEPRHSTTGYCIFLIADSSHGDIKNNKRCLFPLLKPSTVHWPTQLQN